MHEENPINWFRDAAPYIYGHRGKIFVIFISGASIENDNFNNLIKDIALLHGLGTKIVIVFGARAQIDSALAKAEIEVKIINDLRVTDEKVLDIVKEQVSDIRLKIEAAISVGLDEHEISGHKVKVASGNFIKAKPAGVLDGVDFMLTGNVRSIDTANIKSLLQQDSIVLLSSLGFSATGEIFNLNAEEVATATAIDLKVDKLIFLGTGCKVLDYKTNIGFLTTRSAKKLLAENKLHVESRRNLTSAIKACDNGISRVHLLNSTIDGILLEELFTPNGAGTLVTDTAYEKIREASEEDMPSIHGLIKPLQDKGILLERSEEKILNDIDNFYVLEQDKKIIGVAALYIYPEGIGEVASIAVHQDYQNSGHGNKLLKFIEMSAKVAGLEKLFALSTQASHWFMEYGYVEVDIANLPVEKQNIYNYKRNSKAFLKTL